ncbi:uncharacterized protein CANTADRAFT_25099, partial [Suhomyces tanzawaensis NRRL Y-17324]
MSDNRRMYLVGNYRLIRKHFGKCFIAICCKTIDISGLAGIHLMSQKQIQEHSSY